MRPTSGLTPGRREKADEHPEDGYRLYVDDHRAVDYFSENGFRSLKIEYPSVDRLAFEVAERFPNCAFLSSYRPFEKIALSHANLDWGLDPVPLLNKYQQHVDFLAELLQIKPVFFIDIEQRERLNLDALMLFLGRSGRKPDNSSFFEHWAPVNKLSYRLARDGAPANTDRVDISLPDKVLAAGADLDRLVSSWVSASNAKQ